MNRPAAGFTLLEVLVALAIIAFALAATIRLTGQAAANTATLKEKTLAQWVAQNLVTEMRLGLINARKKKGETEMADETWYWLLTESEGPFGLTELGLVVSKEKDVLDAPLVRLRLYRGTREIADLPSLEKQLAPPPGPQGGNQDVLP